MARVTSWVVDGPARPMRWAEREERPGPGEVVVGVAGCGVCHTDLGFFYDGIPTRRGFPLTLGHEVSGRVVEAGAGAGALVGEAVIVPAVLPCGTCPACLAGRGQVCPTQVFPGSDIDGGFGTHLRVPARGLCAVPDLGTSSANPRGLDLAALSVIADAVTTPYQAILRSGLAAGDLAVFVGVGGIGGFGVQIAAALGAAVVAIDVSEVRLEQVARHGASLVLSPSGLDAKQLRRRVREFGDARGVPAWRTRIFETSGTPAGQLTAFGLLGHGSVLSVVGYTPASVDIRLSNLMAYDAIAQGNWGCLPEHYPAVLDLVLQGRVEVEPFIERRSLATINEVFEEIHQGRTTRRIVLIPEQ